MPFTSAWPAHGSKATARARAKTRSTVERHQAVFLEIFRQVKCTSRMLMVVLTEASLDKLPLLDFRHPQMPGAGGPGGYSRP